MEISLGKIKWLFILPKDSCQAHTGQESLYNVLIYNTVVNKLGENQFVGSF